MAQPRKPRVASGAEPPADWRPTQAVDDPIINGPYDEPTQHWVYRAGEPFKVPGRRPASYWFRTQKVGEAQQSLLREQESDDLPLVNRLRTDVKRWREAGYRGASPVTRELFTYWFRSDNPKRRFFCQQEAVETMIYLLELALPARLSATGFKNFEITASDIQKLLNGERPSFSPDTADEHYPRLVDRPADPDLLPLTRLGCKMATGSGKTLVMGMLITWAFCNRGRNPASAQFPNGIVICAPNLTVRKRLKVLEPSAPGNYYDLFDLVPGKYRELRGVAKVLITNWHAFAPKSEHREGDVSYKVVQKGEETADAFAKDRLGELSNRLPVLVLNDEGHHCWRPKAEKPDTKGLTAEEKYALEQEIEEARVWLAGLDRINNSGLIGKGTRGILATIDLSATPFYLSNSGYPEGSPFQWLVSDFGLVDAIESGIVKIPRLPVLDDTKAKDDAGRPDPRYFHLWRHVRDGIKEGDRVGKKVKPESLFREAEDALVTLAGQWKRQFEKVMESSPGESAIPPVLIIACDNTELSEVVYQYISGERVEKVLDDAGKEREQVVYGQGQLFPDLLGNSETVRRTVRIDSKLLAKIETDEGESKDDAATALRDLIDTVGKRGQPGEQVRCVVSVSMLTEGWDANNVTHILGIRAFESQLLCEQVVGRGLRRISYDVNKETGRLEAEYVDVYGIPFSLIPFKGKPKDTKETDSPQHRIFSVAEKMQYQIDMPIVEGYTYDLRESGISCDVSKLQPMIVEKLPTTVYLKVARGYEEEGAALSPDDTVAQTREAFYEATRPQQVIFRLAAMVTDALVIGGTGEVSDKLKNTVLSRHTLYPEIVRILNEYVATKVQFAPGVDMRELALTKYANLVKERVLAGILPRVASEKAPLLPIINKYEGLATTDGVDEVTRRPIRALGKSHLNAAAVLSGAMAKQKGEIDEARAIDILEDMDSVEAFAPNSRKIGFQIPWEYQGTTRRYEPDYLVRMRGKKTVILEIKGGKGTIHGADEVKAKNAAAEKWTVAVNNAKKYGTWSFEICEHLSELRPMLEKHAAPEPGKVLPFRRLTPKPDERFKTCVPLVGLRAAAGAWSDVQETLPELDDPDIEWVTWDAARSLSKDMFVARVIGRSMEPTIPHGSYCAFRRVSLPSSPDRVVLVRYAGAADPETGGQYTVKLYREEKGPNGEKVVKLQPVNPEYEPIVVTAAGEGDVRVIAEVVEVLEVRR
jgi:type III restriction enzyme